MNLRGLYAITTEALCRDPARLPVAVEAALRGGAALVQYRDKWNDAATRLRLARQLAPICRERGAPLVINDDPRLAVDAGASGVHLGAGDASFDQARRLLGPQAVIGMTCGNRLERALAAQDQGASYVSFGRFFDSRTKPEAPPAQASLLEQALPRLRIPVCVIGGLTPDNAAPLVELGADLVAAAGGVFDAGDIEAAARRYTALFSAP